MSATPETDANKVRASRCACGLLPLDAQRPSTFDVIETNDGTLHSTIECVWLTEKNFDR